MRKAERFFKGIGLFLLNVTWCAPGTALGLVLALFLLPFSRAALYRGMIAVYHPCSFTLRLGAFAFISNRAVSPEKARGNAYGYYLASLAWGPLFLFVITVPGYIVRLPSVLRRRLERGLSPEDAYPVSFPARLAKRFGE